MKTRIESYDVQHLDAVVQLSLRAWAPVFVSMKATMDIEVYDAFYPDGWHVSQEQAVTGVLADNDIKVWVALEAMEAVGFVAVKLDPEGVLGQIYMVAVDPDSQGKGVGSDLTAFAVDAMRDAGMSIAMVETGGDPGHAPARQTYEKAGFGLFPAAQYFKKL